MRDFLIVMLQCSISMSLVTLAYATLTPFFSKRYAAKWRYMAWLVIATGWVFPFRPQVDLPFIFPQPPAMPGTPVWSIAGMLPLAADTTVDTGSMASVTAAIPVWTILTAVWILGIVSLIMYHALRHVRFMKINAPVERTCNRLGELASF
jgi:beta-lactamase regulating signal transducer with metallopeptidase domain